MQICPLTSSLTRSLTWPVAYVCPHDVGSATFRFATTKDLNDQPCTTCITFEFSECVYYKPFPGLAASQFVDAYLDGVKIGGTITHDPAANPTDPDPFVKRWSMTFQGTAIQDARLAGPQATPGDPYWMGQDNFTLGITEANAADLFWTRTCYPNDDDKPIDPITDYPVTNLYIPPRILEARI